MPWGRNGSGISVPGQKAQWFSMQQFHIFNYTAHIQHNLWQGLWYSQLPFPKWLTNSRWGKNTPNPAIAQDVKEPEDLPWLASASSQQMSGLKQFLEYFSCCFCNYLLDLFPSLPWKLRGLLQDCQHTLAGRRKALSISQEERFLLHVTPASSKPEQITLS